MKQCDTMCHAVYLSIVRLDCRTVKSFFIYFFLSLGVGKKINKSILVQF